MASLWALQIQALPLSWRNSSSSSNNAATIFIPQQQQQQHRLPSSSPITSTSIVAQKKAKKTRKIILKEDMSELGKKGEMVEVKPGFFRNYLLPLGKAQIVTPLLLREMRMEEERIEAEKKRAKEEAQQLALIFQTVGAFKVKRKGGKGKQIFGSVTAQDLVDIIKAQLQRDVDKRNVSLPEIRETGEYIAELKLHPEVTAQVKVNVFAN